jgi:hypothetical protein
MTEMEILIQECSELRPDLVEQVCKFESQQTRNWVSNNKQGLLTGFVEALSVSRTFLVG